MKGSQKKSSEIKEYLRVGELTKVTGVRQSTIKFYVINGLLPYKQDSEGMNRRYPKEETLKRLKEIEKLKKQRFTIEEIKTKLLKP